MLPWRHSAVAAGNYSGLSASRDTYTQAGTQWQIVTPGHGPLRRDQIRKLSGMLRVEDLTTLLLHT